MKKIAVINDLSGVGRCSLSVAMPIISVLGYECCPFPTAVLSNQTGFDSFFCEDFTDKIDVFANEWKKLGVSFDGILTGFLGSAAQVEKILKFINEFKKEHTLLVVDPVMADDGEIYSTYDKELCDEIKKLTYVANVITPNLTELCILSGENYFDVISYCDNDDYFEKIKIIASKLLRGNLKTVIVTGIHKNNYIYNLCVSKEEIFYMPSKKFGNGYSGTGDIFSAIVTGMLVKGESVKSAVYSATSFLEKAIEDTFNEETDRNYGVNFQKYLGDLINEK